MEPTLNLGVQIQGLVLSHFSSGLQAVFLGALQGLCWVAGVGKHPGSSAQFPDYLRQAVRQLSIFQISLLWKFSPREAFSSGENLQDFSRQVCLSVILKVGGVCVYAKSFQSCPTLCDPMDCSPPGFSVHGTLQARILQWVPRPSSRGCSQSRD